MSAKDFFYAHGEKVAVSVTLILCALQLYTVYSDESIRPRDISTERINSQNLVIDKIFADGKPPTLKPIPDYLGDMKQRFMQTLAPTVADSWLTAPPDRGPSARGLLAYVYEAPAPSLTAVDAVGKASLTIALPAPARMTDRRLADAREVSWKRPDENIVNRAMVVGLFIEVRIGDGEWKPYAGHGAIRGMLPLAALPATGNLVVDGLEPWVRHSFRVSQVVKATGPELGVTPSPSQAVLVVPGRVPSDDLAWNDLSERLRSGDPTFLARYAKPLTGPLPEAFDVQQGERVYLGGRSDDVVVPITSEVQLSFLKVATDPADATKEVIHVLVTRMVTQPDGAVSWLPEPKVLKAARGQPIAGEVDVKTDRGIARVKIDTGFRVLDVRREQKRVLYYEVREKTRQGAKGKDLDILKKESQTDVLVVESIRSGNRMEFVKLNTIRRPARADAITYPAIPEEGINEEELFRKQPGSNQKAELVPVAPRFHPPGTGPLVKVRADHPGNESFYETDTPYIELPGPRLVWYEPINRKVRQWPEPEAAQGPATDPAAAPQPPVPGAEPGRVPAPTVPVGASTPPAPVPAPVAATPVHAPPASTPVPAAAQPPRPPVPTKKP